MWDDLEAKRPTEIDHLQGEVVALAKRLGTPAPINAALVRLVRAAEAGGKRDFTRRAAVRCAIIEVAMKVALLVVLAAGCLPRRGAHPLRS